MDVDDAVESGVVAKTKVEGRWLYYASETSLDRASSRILDEATRIVSSWFIVPMPWLPSIASKRTPELTKDAAEVLLHQLVRKDAFSAFGLLTKRNQPYLALHLPDDAAAVEEKVAAMEAIMERHSRVGFRELPDPPRAAENEGWRATVLQHGEFLGLGMYGNWELIGWGAV
jgi:hypothetical protein